MSERVDWAALMRVGLGLLRLSPDAFWGMTPREFSRAVEGAGLAAPGTAALSRAGLETLMERFPDRKEHRHDR